MVRSNESTVIVSELCYVGGEMKWKICFILAPKLNLSELCGTAPVHGKSQS
jgi:hypothetical protein